MGLTPLFKRNDTVYLATSSAIGQLEGYRIASIVQRSPGAWLYRIEWIPKPPESATIGDRYDQRYPAYSVLYSERELQNLCDALTSVVDNLEKRLTRIMEQQEGVCPTAPVCREDDTPLYRIGDIIYILASAKIGFLEKAKILNIQGTATNTASNTRRFVYQLTVKQSLYFGEGELTTFCRAAELVTASIVDQLSVMRQKLQNECDPQTMCNP